jgi:protein-S-isoprenylcysteine O-methyltransferase Ste14
MGKRRERREIDPYGSLEVMPSLVEETMACILVSAMVIAIAMNINERKRKKKLPPGEYILESRLQRVILQGLNGVFALLYFALAPYLLLLGYFDEFLGWSTISSLFAHPSIILALQVSGIVLFIAGMAFVVAGHLTLKEYFADLWAPSRQAGDFVQTGIYGRIRHPIYSGTMMFEAALVLFFQTWFGLILLVPCFAIIVKTASKEEKVLRKKFGKRYDSYISKTRRFL